MVRRTDRPDGLALPSGFIEYGEVWQDAAAREVAEETGVHIDPRRVRELCVRSGADGTLLVFATCPAVDAEALDTFRASEEVSELIVVDGPRDDLVFPLDGDVIAERFAARDR